jgi:hypothetical protein
VQPHLAPAALFIELCRHNATGATDHQQCAHLCNGGCSSLAAGATSLLLRLAGSWCVTSSGSRCEALLTSSLEVSAAAPALLAHTLSVGLHKGRSAPTVIGMPAVGSTRASSHRSHSSRQEARLTRAAGRSYRLCCLLCCLSTVPSGPRHRARNQQMRSGRRQPVRRVCPVG